MIGSTKSHALCNSHNHEFGQIGLIFLKFLGNLSFLLHIYLHFPSFGQENEAIKIIPLISFLVSILMARNHHITFVNGHV